MPVYQFSAHPGGRHRPSVDSLPSSTRRSASALSQWILSWACLLAGLVGFWFAPPSAYDRDAILLNHSALLAHAFFLLRGIRRLREEKGSGGADLVWLIPVFGLAWVTATGSQPEHSALVALILAAAYVTAAVSFAVTPGSTVGRLLLSVSFLLWGVQQAVVGAAFLRFRDPAACPRHSSTGGSPRCCWR
jgi:hypothetical protein